jgi:hypothetical protein
MSDKYFRHFGKMQHLDEAIVENDSREFPTDFWVSEKIDGCNVGIYINQSGISCFSRNGNNASGLFDFEEDAKVLLPLIQAIQEKIPSDGCDYVYLWGEYYGSRINRRINYGVQSGFRFYDGFVSYGGVEVRLNPKVLESFKEVWLKNKFDDFFVKYTKYTVKSLSELMSLLPLPSKSEYSEDEREGYVITEITNKGYVLHYKYKAPNFRDKPPKLKFEDLSETKKVIMSLNETFKAYLNTARVTDVFSKNTNLCNENIPELCRQLVEDAKEDFVKDYSEELAKLDDGERKKVYNVGGMPFRLVKTELSKRT